MSGVLAKAVRKILSILPAGVIGWLIGRLAYSAKMRWIADDRDQTANVGHAVNITAKAINGNTVRTILYNQASSIIDHDGPPKQTKWTIDILTLTASASIYVQ